NRQKATTHMVLEPLRLDRLEKRAPRVSKEEREKTPSQTLRVDENMALLALDLLARIIAVRVDPRPPFSALFTCLPVDNRSGVTSTSFMFFGNSLVGASAPSIARFARSASLMPSACKCCSLQC